MADSSQDIEDLHKVEDDTERIRELTEKGKEQYEECINAYRNTIDQAWGNVQSVLDELTDCDVEQLSNLEQRVHECYEKYSRVSNEFIEYLYNTRTSESRAEFHLMKRDRVSGDKLFKSAMNQIKIMRNADAKSMSTTSSRKSRARAKLEAILSKVKLAEEEAALYKRKAIIRQQTDEEQVNADLNVLRIKREAVDAEVEVKVADEDAKNVPHDLNIPVDKNRTERYITEHFGQTKHHDFYAASAQPDENVPFVSNTTIPLQQSPRNDSNLASQLTTFLLKKDLLMTRLTTFDEKPEHYLSWKVNFKGMISELNVTPSEEIDLLIRWLGPDSGRHAKTIRSSLSSDPTWGIAKIWERLDERFGAPEMVEAAIKERLSSFPRIGNKDNKKLYELVDIMIEIESLMANPQYTVLLSYFNSSSGVLPIINKLPYNIQEKWTMRAANYKKQHSVPFPPFSLVLNFVKEISKIRNDPSFSYLYEQQAQKPNIGNKSKLEF